MARNSSESAMAGGEEASSLGRNALWTVLRSEPPEWTLASAPLVDEGLLRRYACRELPLRQMVRIQRELLERYKAWADASAIILAEEFRERGFESGPDREP